MTCKDCVHYEVCKEQDAMLGENTIDEIVGVESVCEFFKPKSRFVELPCEVGQKVWFVNSTNWQQTEWEVAEGKVSMIQQKADKSWKVRISHNSSVWDITLDNIGKEYFLSHEKAVKALAERSK
jgi:hypothetical protein